MLITRHVRKTLIFYM